jgi:hypothetical protein
MMTTDGQLTSAVVQSITGEMNQKGYDVFYDHGRTGGFAGTIAVSFNDKLSRENEISQLDRAIIKKESKKVITLVEIEETTDNPKTLISDIFAVLMGNSIHLKRIGKVEVGDWTTLVILGRGSDHESRNEYIQKKANNAKFDLGTENSKIGNIIVESFRANVDLEKVLMDLINKAILKQPV